MHEEMRLICAKLHLTVASATVAVSLLMKADEAVRPLSGPCRLAEPQKVLQAVHVPPL